MRYHRPEHIEKQLRSLEIYLQEKRYAPETIRQNKNYVGIFLEWVEEQGLGIRDIEYGQITDFIFFLRNPDPSASGQLNSIGRTKRASISKTKSMGYVRRVVLAVRHYYNSLGLDQNPATGIYMRVDRSTKKGLQHIVPYEQLLQLYQDVETTDNRSKRNKIILGLYIFQAINTGALHRLEVRHVHLEKGSIYIPAVGSTNRRTLPLHAAQLLDLQAYITDVRPQILVQISEPGDPVIYDRLCFSERGSVNLKSSLHHLFRGVRNLYPDITSGHVIRASVITHWLKTLDVRIVQYRAGHRYVSSTERYKAYNLESLTEALQAFHPLRLGRRPSK